MDECGFAASVPTKGVTAILLLAVLMGGGCQSPVASACGGLIHGLQVPLVTVESVTPTKDSASWGYPLFQFPLPLFPSEMLRAGITGEVMVRANVGADGVVRSVSIVRSTQREFESHALAGVQRWRFVEFVPPTQRSPNGYTVDCLIKFGFDES